MNTLINPNSVPYLTRAELMARPDVRSVSYATGKFVPHANKHEVIEFISDGYRIYGTWAAGAPLSSPEDECVVICEYKHCDSPTLAEHFVNAFFSPMYSAQDPWFRAVEDALSACHSTASSFSSPHDAVKSLIDWHCAVQIDPAVSSAARELIEQGKNKAISEAHERMDKLFGVESNWLPANSPAQPSQPDKIDHMQGLGVLASDVIPGPTEYMVVCTHHHASLKLDDVVVVIEDPNSQNWLLRVSDASLHSLYGDYEQVVHLALIP